MKFAAIASATVMLGATLAASAASAQSVGIYVGPGPSSDYYYDDGYYGYEPAPAPVYRGPGRVYGYVRRDRDPDLIGDRATQRSEGNCGTYRYWDGEACVDARAK